MFGHTGERIRSLKIRVSIIEMESLHRPNSDLKLVSGSGELSPALDRKVLFSVSGFSKNQTERDIYTDK